MSDEPNESLILAEEEKQASQLFLFHAGDLAKIQVDRSKPKFHCTGERLFRDRPEIYRLCKDMTAEGIADRQIERACHVSHHTLESLREREAVPIIEHKKAALATAARVNHMLIDKLEELVPTMKAGEATLAYGITFDKVAVGSGDASARLEVIHKVDVSAKIDSAFEKIMGTFAAMKQAQVVEVKEEVKQLEEATI